MTEPLLKVVREVIEKKLAHAEHADGGGRGCYIEEPDLGRISDELARNVMQAFMPTLEAYAEACALLDQTLGMLDPRDFRSSADQEKLQAVREFLGGASVALPA